MIANSLKLFYARGLQHLVNPNAIRVSQAASMRAMPIRGFATRSDEEVEAAEEAEEAAAEPEPTPEPEPVSAAQDMSEAF